MLNHIPFFSFFFFALFFLNFCTAAQKYISRSQCFVTPNAGLTIENKHQSCQTHHELDSSFVPFFFNYPLSPLDVFCAYRVIIVMKQSSTTMQKDQLVNAAHLCNCTALYMVDQKGPAAQAISKPMGTQLIGTCKAQRKRNFVQGTLCLTNFRIEIRYYGTIIMKIGNLSIAKFNVACQRKGLLRRRQKLPRERCTCRD